MQRVKTFEVHSCCREHWVVEDIAVASYILAWPIVEHIDPAYTVYTPVLGPWVE